MKWQRLRSILWNQQGQMAIFVALIFQILFVLFAMVINVGMLVHDKINLQNSVDLAAYYGAQRQAELLNAIAHENYQIRQAWKLLTFRYWVISSVANKEHPSSPVTGGSVADPYADEQFTIAYPDGSLRWPPQVCVISSIWRDQPNKDQNLNMCKRQDSVVTLAEPPSVIFGGINVMVSELFRESNRRIGENCESMGYFNWMIATKMYYAFRQDQANRRWVIRRLADQLSRSNTDFLSLQGESVFEGVQKVVSKNLTNSNREGNLTVDMYNSLAFAQGREAWLQDILVAPAMFYTDSKSCSPNVEMTTRSTHLAPSIQTSDLSSIKPFMPFAAGSEPSDSSDLMHSSVGVEKNPWAMAYVGVRATSTPRKPFSPFGPTVTLTARAFAKPFGGRVGPWYGSVWPRGNTQSVGATEETKVDALLPPRMPSSLSTYSLVKNLPNHSRYPGDRLGMNSRLSLRMLYNALKANSGFGGAGGLALAWYDHLTDPLGEPMTGAVAKDPLASGSGAWVRNAELAALSPDLFDLTYYSIEPNFDANYMQPLSTAASLGLGGGDGVRGDLGSRQGPGGLENFNVSKQISSASSYLSSVISFYFYKALSADQLLTAWTSNSATDYSFATNFGRCKTPPLPSTPNPGDCVGGGRVGYSVKLVSREFLKGTLHNYGNDGGQDAILNPPPDDF